MEIKYIILLLSAGVLRYLLINSKISNMIGNRVEVSTPINSYKKLQEGIHLYQNRIDPYYGDMVHENPFILVTLSWFVSTCPRCIPLLYIFLDLLTAVLLFKMSIEFIKQKIADQKLRSSEFAENTENLQLQPSDLIDIPKYVLITYLFNPYSILNCVGLTSTVFSNLFLALYFYFLAKKNIMLCLLFLALETVRSLYPFVLIAPVILIFARNSVRIAINLTILFITLCMAVIWINFSIIGRWTFLNGTLGFIFFYRDLQPNIGLFWYFFTEMFDHFRTMFLITFQMNATVLYSVPLSIKLRKEPLMLGTILTSLIAVFRSYPCVGDIAFYLALIPLWKRCWKFMAHNFVVFGTFLVTSLLLPALWQLWMYNGSANANFFFGATLAFSTGQIFLITDLLFAYVKREFCLRNGQQIYVNGKEANIVLD